MGIGGEMALPEAVAQNNNAGAVGLIFFGGEGAALNYRRAQQTKIIGGDANAVDLLRERFSGQIKIAAGVFVGGGVLKGLRLLTPDIEAGGGASTGGSVRGGKEERNDTVRVGGGERV